jgi:hypothetical protein
MTKRVPSDFEPWEDAAFALCSDARCPSPDLLLPALEGTLEEPALTQVREHVSKCAMCRELTEALERAAAEGPTLEERSRLDARRPRQAGRESKTAWWPAAVAASVILVAGMFWLSRFMEFRSMSAPPVSKVAVGAPSPPEFVLPLDAPFVNVPESPIVLRGGEPDRFVPALIEAAKPLRNRDYAAAAREMAALRRQYPDRPHPAFYEGVSLLMSGRPADAREPLEEARRLSERGTSLHIDASWYLAVAFERVGRRADSIAILTELCGSAGARDEQVCSALHALTTRTIGGKLDAVPVVSGLFADPLLPDTNPI